MLVFKKIKNNKELFYLILVSALGVFAGSLLAPIEAIYLSTLTPYKTLVGLTFSIGTVFIFFFSLLTGRLSHYIRRRKMVVVGLTIGILFPFVYASAINIFQYMFGRSAWAFASVTTGVIIGALFQDMIKKKENIAEIAGFKSSICALAGALGAVFSGFLADKYYLTTPFYWVSFVYFIALLFFIFKVYEKIEPMPEEKRRVKKGFRLALKDIIKNPFLFLRVFLEGITQSHWAMEPIIFPIIIYNLSAQNLQTGFVFGVMGVVAMLTLPLAGKYIDKHTSVRGLKIAFSLYSLAFLILYLANSVWFFAVGAIILSVGKSFNRPAFTKIETKRIATENRIEYLSYFKAYDTLTAALTCLAIGIMLDFISPQNILLIFAGFTILGSASGFIIFSQKQKHFKAS